MELIPLFISPDSTVNTKQLFPQDILLPSFKAAACSGWPFLGLWGEILCCKNWSALQSQNWASNRWKCSCCLVLQTNQMLHSFQGKEQCFFAIGPGAIFAVITFAKVVIIMYRTLSLQILLQGCSWDSAVVGTP